MHMSRAIPSASFFVLLTLTVFQAALAQCPDPGTGDSQKGCPDPFRAEISRPQISRDYAEFNITVWNRRIAFPPDCNPGECFENMNYLGLPLCLNWSEPFQDAGVELVSCYPSCDLVGCPDCDFNVSIEPQKVRIENGKSVNYTVRIKSYNAIGDHDFTFSSLVSSVKKKVFSIRLRIREQARGKGGDNLICPWCGSADCDTEENACEAGCPGAEFCSPPECLFDTPYPGASESCCGDDSEETFVQCSREVGIGWNCPTQAACCESPGNCVHSGSCYAEGGAHLLGADADKYAYCSSGTWRDCDSRAGICASCGFSWIISACCGDDTGEFYMSRICFSGCETNMTDRSCCAIGTACVYNGTCHATGEIIVLGGKNVTCEGGVWTEKLTNQSVCYKGECNKKNRCELPCPGCIFKDYSCYGTNCEPDFRDPDTHWTYCGACMGNWSPNDRMCCGDDEKEYWSPPCPGAAVPYGCCSNPSERVSRNGECVIFCGTTMTANATELQESSIPLSVSMPETINVVAGNSAEFRVLVSTDGDMALHSLMLGFCGPFSLNVSPLVMDELAPNETKSFTVRFPVSSDSAPGPYGFSVYVSGSELTVNRYVQAVANVQLPPEQQIPYEVYFGVAAALAVIYIAKKLRSRSSVRSEKRASRQARTSERRLDSIGPSRQARREAARQELAELVREDLEKGTPEKELRSMLLSSGLKREDVEAAFRQAKKKNS